MRVLFVLTYYRPHVSGLTIYVERLARLLAERGHRVTVLTSHYQKDLPREEMLDGVRVVRVPVLVRLNKGVFMPTLPAIAWREMRAHDVVSIHLPQVEAAGVTFLARLAGHRPILTYHCDLEMPPVWYGPIVDRVTYWNNVLAGWLADTIVAYTEDYACHSPVLKRFGIEDCEVPPDQGGRRGARGGARSSGQGPGGWLRRLRAAVQNRKSKIRVILPPVVIPEPQPEGVEALRASIGLDGRQRVIGFAARFAHEKGADYLINSIPYIRAEIPDIHILFAGPYKDVIGETIWYDLQPLIKQSEEYLTFLGTLNPTQMADFFRLCDVVTVASINHTESFGLVQVEAFMCGTPVVATNLPGVRQPITMTGMGEIVPIADARGLARGIVEVLRDPERYVRPHAEIMRIFDLQRTVDEYERLFQEKCRHG